MKNENPRMNAIAHERSEKSILILQFQLNLISMGMGPNIKGAGARSEAGQRTDGNPHNTAIPTHSARRVAGNQNQTTEV